MFVSIRLLWPILISKFKKKTHTQQQALQFGLVYFSKAHLSFVTFYLQIKHSIIPRHLVPLLPLFPR